MFPNKSIERKRLGKVEETENTIAKLKSRFVYSFCKQTEAAHALEDYEKVAFFICVPSR